MQKVAEVFFNTVLRAKPQGPLTILLYGDLGAGKTTFTSHMARTLGITHEIQSPTFVMKKYEIKSKELLDGSSHNYAHFVHIDAYRIEAEDEVRVLGLKETINDANTLSCIEWPDHMKESLPEQAIKMRISHGEDADGACRLIDFSWKLVPNLQQIIEKSL